MVRKKQSTQQGIKGEVDTLKQRIDQQVDNAVLRLYQELIEKTPMDNEVAKANWAIGMQPNEQQTNPRQQAEAIRLPKNWKRLYITNTDPKVLQLEYGHSRKAPIGWFRSCIDNFKYILKELQRERSK